MTMPDKDYPYIHVVSSEPNTSTRPKRQYRPDWGLLGFIALELGWILWAILAK